MSDTPPSVREDGLLSPALTVNLSVILLRIESGRHTYLHRAPAWSPDGFTAFLSHPSAEDDTEISHIAEILPSTRADIKIYTTFEVCLVHRVESGDVAIYHEDGSLYKSDGPAAAIDFMLLWNFKTNLSCLCGLLTENHFGLVLIHQWFQMQQVEPRLKSFDL